MNDNGNLFGNLENSLGFEVCELKSGYSHIKVEVKSLLLNKIGYLHGGAISTLLDDVGACTGCYIDEKTYKDAVTINLNINFIRGVNSGVVHAKGEKLGGGKKVFFASMKLFDDEGNLLASGSATYRYVS